jgi:chemotaxis protein MotB
LKEDLQKKDKAQHNMAVKLAEILDENNDNKFSLMSIKKECKRLRKDSSALTKAQQKLLEDLMEYQVVNEKLSNNYDELLSNSGNRNQNLIKQLGEKEQALAEKKRLLDEQTNSLSELEKALKSREARVSELENIIDKQDQKVGALKDKLSKALLGFSEGELSVDVKDGKVYVSLSNKLLFKSGSIEVDPKGITALDKLATALSSNKDIYVMIEGHTDTDKLVGKSAIKDNWDLSVLRATSIVRILTKGNKLDPKRVTPAGRGEFMPVASNETTEDKGKNRRTEIIITPDLSELFQLLEAN